MPEILPMTLVFYLLSDWVSYLVPLRLKQIPETLQCSETLSARIGPHEYDGSVSGAHCKTLTLRTHCTSLLSSLS
ncbi:hypothetical protein VNO80_03762 [Phaseolus coccineus]|uniref:Uncharacterized protein n=1 Tax=Phaseolus coccineus TaxID=3886 RepID=A0AAN9NZH4_PHACN